MDADDRLAAAAGGVARFFGDSAGLPDEITLELESSVLSACKHCFHLQVSPAPCEVRFHRLADRLEVELALPAEEAPAEKGHLAWAGVDEVHCETGPHAAVLRLTKYMPNHGQP
jgi:hypothetical protein